MAKYTELFGEYLQNNTLPNIFDEIENFKSLFILKYIDSEIGFETEYLFTQKLLLYANLYIPEYKKRIEALKNVENTLFNKLQLKTQETINASYLNGEQTQKQTILPFNADNAKPNNITVNETVTNTETHTNEILNDLSLNDIKSQYDTILNTKEFLLNKLLKEFKPLFMGVY